MPLTNGWVEWAQRRDGPPQKMFSQANAHLGIVLHSVEGWLGGAFGELDKPDRQASWHFTNGLDGTLYQHYPVTASCWASGNFNANTMYVAMESEGVAGTPLNEAQVATALRLLRDLGFTERGLNVFEHNEVATRWSPNSGPTACPSGRYQPLYAALEDDMADPRVDDILTTLEATGIKAWKDNGNEPIIQTIGKIQSDIAAIRQTLDGLVASGGMAYGCQQSYALNDILIRIQPQLAALGVVW